jgi:predicted acylesterase/phospholipase RssA
VKPDLPGNSQGRILVRCPHRWLGYALAAALVPGCTTLRDHPSPNLSPQVQLTNIASQAPAVAESETSILRAGSIAATKLDHVLILSGGGMNGAFPAGLLTGWSEAGTRPRFDVVTGISTGALIAPFAFLGSEYDSELERVYTTLTPGEVFRRRFLLSLPWADALADSEPLRLRIKKEISAEVLDKIADEHREGRRLYVGTTNLDTQQLVVWDMGAIAASDDPQKLALFQEILLASCSVPGLLPPVPINISIDGQKFTELHADGNVGASLFLPSQLQNVRSEIPGAEEVGSTNVYVVIAGKLIPETTAVERHLFSVTDVSLRGLIQSQMESDLQRVYLMTRMSGANFHLAAIPQDLALPTNSMSFDTKTIRTVFEAGRQFALGRGVWESAPPGISPSDWKTPRVGTSFTRQTTPRVGRSPRDR